MCLAFSKSQRAFNLQDECLGAPPPPFIQHPGLSPRADAGNTSVAGQALVPHPLGGQEPAASGALWPTALCLDSVPAPASVGGSHI